MLTKITIYLLLVWCGLITYTQYKITKTVVAEAQLLLQHEGDIEQLQKQLFMDRTYVIPEIPNYKLKPSPKVNPMPEIQDF